MAHETLEETGPAADRSDRSAVWKLIIAALVVALIAAAREAAFSKNRQSS